MENPASQIRVPTVTVEQFYLDNAEDLQLKLLAGGSGLSRTIREGSVNRPGLALAGFYKYFALKRVQVLGGAEAQFLKSLGVTEACERVRRMLDKRVPCLVYARNLNPPRRSRKPVMHSRCRCSRPR